MVDLSENATVLEAVKLMAENRVGSVLLKSPHSKMVWTNHEALLQTEIISYYRLPGSLLKETT